VKQSPEEKAATAAEELRALIREAHEAAQTLAQVMREARLQVEGYLYNEVQTATANYTRQMQEMTDQWYRDARGDVARVLTQLNAAMGSVCTIVVNGLSDPTSGTDLHADVVIDLRGQHPVWVPGDSAQASAILADAQYTIMLGPNARPGGVYLQGDGPAS